MLTRRGSIVSSSGISKADCIWLITSCDGLDLSLEFLMGRALDNAMLNVGMKEVAEGTPHILPT